MLFKVLVALFLCSIASAGIFSSQKNSFKVGDLINLKVNGLSSSKTHIPYEFYYLPFPKVCTVPPVRNFRSLRRRCTRHPHWAS